MMFDSRIISARTLVLLVAALGLVSSACASDQSAGTWRVNVAKSKFPPGQRPPMEEIFIVTIENGQRIVTEKGIDADGKPLSAKTTEPEKGGPLVRVEGPPPPPRMTAEDKLVNDYTLERRVFDHGKQVITMRLVVSKDGKTRTETEKGATRDGKPFESVIVYDRQ